MPDDERTPLEYAKPTTSSRRGPSPDVCSAGAVVCYFLGAPIVAISTVGWLADGMYFDAVRRGVLCLALGIALCLAGRWFDKRQKLEVRDP